MITGSAVPVHETYLYSCHEKNIKRFVPCRLLLISASDGDLDMLIVKKTGDRKSGLWSFFSPRTSHLTRFSLSFDD